MPSRMTRLPMTALAIAAVAAAGCGPGPFTRAASAYGAATEASTDAIAAAPATADRVCRRHAQFAYIQNRLDVLQTPAPIGWNDWFATAKATRERTWAEHCADLAASGKLFKAGLAALRQYAAALEGLVGAGKYDGSDLSTVAEGAGKVAAALESDKAAAAMKPVGNLVGRFATFLLDDVTEDQVEIYVRRADPLVQPLVEALEGYVKALEDEIAGAESFQRETLRALEVRGELDGAKLPATPATLLLFHDFANDTEDDIAATRAVVAGYKAVLARIRAAHGAMVKAGERGDELDLKKSLGATFELLSQLQALNSALSKE